MTLMITLSVLFVANFGQQSIGQINRFKVGTYNVATNCPVTNGDELHYCNPFAPTGEDDEEACMIKCGTEYKCGIFWDPDVYGLNCECATVANCMGSYDYDP